jgi:hypothetical protein
MLVANVPRDHPYVFATAISGTLVGSCPRLTVPKHLFTSVFEWFGELGLFCMRLFRAV